MDGCDHQITEPTAKGVAPLPLTHNGFPIPPWTETGREYLVLERFPHLRKRLEGGELAGDAEPGLEFCMHVTDVVFEF